MLKIKTENVAENAIAVIFPAETLQRLGISAGDEIDVTTTENALILRSNEEAEKNRKIEAATGKVFSQWDKVFVELARGTEADK